MSAEPTSALTNERLIVAVAKKMGVAFYGDNGDEEAQIPDDDHDLAECQEHVNNAIRMFISDAPTHGWRWTRPIGTITLWPDVAVAAAVTVSAAAYNAAEDYTPLTASAATFYESMEEKEIVVTGQGTFRIKRYVSTTQVYVYGSHYFSGTATFSIASNGNYTLPRTFAGTHSGNATFAAGTNRGMGLSWVDDSVIRGLRENEDESTGTPIMLALRVFVPQESATQRRRYELMAFPEPSEVFVVQFPYDLHFDELTEMDETPPSPIAHDETIRAACRAVVERDVDEESDGPDAAYYAKCLTNSHQTDARSAPRKLGYFGNGRLIATPMNWRNFVRRPNVTYTP